MSISLSGSLVITGSIVASGGITGSFSGSATTSSYALTASSVNPLTQSLSVSGSITATGILTAQTLVVQTITSSIVYSSGSNIFGNQLTNVQQMTGSLRVTGSGNHYILGGNVGIGTSSPSSYYSTKLVVYADSDNGISIAGTSTGERFLMWAKGTTGTDTYIGYIGYNVASDFMRFGTAATERMRITASGSVGIGETNPNSPLSVTATSTAAAVSTGVAYIVNNGTGNGLQVTTSGTAGTSFIFKARSSGVDRFWVGDTGNVGIGTDSPATKLNVVTDANAATEIVRIINTNAGSSATTRLSIGNNASTGATTIIQYSSTHSVKPNTLEIGTQVAGNVDFITGGSDRMRIFSSGIVTIGKTVDDGAVTAGCEFRPEGFGYFSRANGESLFINRKSSDGGQIQFRRDNVDIGNISSTTSVTSYNTTSDYRLKEDFKDFTGLDKICNIKIYDFKWKSDGTRMGGVIAHELQEILPYAVTGEKDALYEDGKPKMQSVDYSKIVPSLVKAIQEQQATITSLQEQINELKNK